MAHIQIGNQNITAAEALTLLAGYQMLPQLCREITIEKAIASIELTIEERTNAVNQFYSKNQITTPEAKAAVLQRYCMTEAQLEAVATKELRIEKFKQATWGAKLESYFLKYKPQLDKVVYSLLRTTEMEVAQELYFRIKAGEETFADCAKQYSQGAEAQTGGLLGPVSLSQPHQAIAQKLAISQPGQLWMPMKLENWYVIIRLEKLVAAQHDDATCAMLLNHLFEQWLSEQLQQTPISLSEVEWGRGENFSDSPHSPTPPLPYSFESPVLVRQ